MTDTHDKDGLPIFGAPVKEEKVKKMTRIEERFRQQANKPVNFADNIRTARFKHHDFVSIEALYRAFKTRLLNEMEE